MGSIMPSSSRFILLQFLLLSQLVEKGRSGSLCPSKCANGAQCLKYICRKCENYCGGGVCLSGQDNYGSMCMYDCLPSDCSTKNKCMGCVFCRADSLPGFKSSDISSKASPISFNDVSSQVFGAFPNYWNRWLHAGMPYKYEGAPLFVDLDGDGLLDYFNSMHAHPVGKDYDDRMELALAFQGNPEQVPRLKPISSNIVINDNKIMSIDTHGENIVDLDGDGILDILIASGGGASSINENSETNGAGKKEPRYNFLFWGTNDKTISENDTNNSTKTQAEQFNTQFIGGRMTAADARLHMAFGRGRYNYILDVNGDGLLDIFCMQDRPATNEIVPGVLLMNNGNRKWKEDWSMSEYSRSMLLTDADGDGLAQELLLSRGFCFPQREGPGVDPNFQNYGSYPSKVKLFCKTRPVGTTAVYKYNKSNNKMENIATKYFKTTPINKKQPPCCPNGSDSGSGDCHVKSMSSGDFDGDLLADHVLLYQTKLVIYYSSDRKANELPGGSDNVGDIIYFPKYCNVGESVRVLDLDNDSVEEIVVMCRNVATFLVYTRINSEWTLNNGYNLKNSLGDLSNPLLSTYSDVEMNKFCIGNYNESSKNVCDEFFKSGHTPQRLTSGVCFVDFNNDGYLDAVVTHDFGYLRFYANTPSTTNKFIAFKINGDRKAVNEYAIGATVILFTRRRSDGHISTQFREISSHQHTADKYGCKDDRVIFGLDSNLDPLVVLVRWPNGVESRHDIPSVWSYNKILRTVDIRYS